MAQSYVLKSRNSGDSRKKQSGMIRDPRSRQRSASLNKSRHGSYNSKLTRFGSKIVSSNDRGVLKRKIRKASREAKKLLPYPKKSLKYRVKSSASS